MGATIVAAPSSTKHATRTGDPEMKQIRKGKNWHFGMNLHIGPDDVRARHLYALRRRLLPPE